MPGHHTCQTLRCLWVVLARLILLYATLIASPGMSLAQDVVTYDDDVFPMVLGPFCISCHSSTLVGADRFGAPPGVDYDTYDLAIQGANEILAVGEVVAGTMPPGAPLSQELIDLMLAWQAAGFPENQGSVGSPGALTAAAGVSGNFNVPELSRVTLDGSDSRAADGMSLPDVFSWAQTQGPAVFLSDPTSPTPSFIAPEVDARTQLQFELTVVDGGETDTATVAITVFDVVQPFSAEANPANGGCAMLPGTRVDPMLAGLTGLMLVFLCWRHMRRQGRP